MKNKNYKYCGSNTNVSNFEDLLNQITGEENTFQFDENNSYNESYSECCFCKRDESFRYCGKNFPGLNVYTGDHYDDIIDAILTYLNEL